MNMKFGSVCSGIEAASMAWNPLGWEASWLAEIEPFPSAVLKHHYPDTPNYGDMTLLPDMVLRGDIEAPDVLVGGTPCQSFSVAGMREGLSDERGQLTIKYVELANAIDTIRRRDGKDESIIVWENVPGVLSSKDNAFGCFIAALAGGSSEARSPRGGRWANAGYVLGPERAVAWRVLDAQYFGLAQRRKRVFVVASARDGFCPAKVLFEFDGVRRDIAPSREAGENTTHDVRKSINATGSHGELVGTLCARDFKGVGNQYVSEGKLVLGSKKWPADIASTLNASFGDKLGLENQHIDGGAPLFVPAKAFGVPGNWIGRKPENGGNSTQFMHEVSPAQTATDKHGVIAFNSRQDPVSGDVFGALDTCSPQAQAIAIQGSMIGRKPENGPQGSGYDETGVCFTQTSADRHAVATQTAVRRLTPIECERLQGFPDDYTQIPWRNKTAEDCPDGHRYKALGNSMAVPVMRWIGGRIADTEGVSK